MLVTFNDELFTVSEKLNVIVAASISRSKDSRYGLISSGVNSETSNASVKFSGTTKLLFIS